MVHLLGFILEKVSLSALKVPEWDEVLVFGIKFKREGLYLLYLFQIMQQSMKVK